jgi:hypothetical protein
VDLGRIPSRLIGRLWGLYFGISFWDRRSYEPLTAVDIQNTSGDVGAEQTGRSGAIASFRARRR